MRLPGREVMLIRWQGELLAVRNKCPHMACSMAKGRVVAPLVSNEVGEVDADNSSPMVECPWHNSGFDLRTGKCLSDPNLRIKTYKVTTEDGRVFIG